MKPPRSGSRRSTCTHGVATNRPQPRRAEQHRDRIARAVHVALPARLHRVELTAPVELHRLLAPWAPGRRPRPALAHAEHRLLVEPERRRCRPLEDAAAGSAGRLDARSPSAEPRVTSTSTPAARFVTGALISRRLERGRGIRAIDDRWRGRESSRNVSGLRVTRRLWSPATRTSSCAGCPAAVIGWATADRGVCQQRGTASNVTDDRTGSSPCRDLQLALPSAFAFLNQGRSRRRM